MSSTKDTAAQGNDEPPVPAHGPAYGALHDEICAGRLVFRFFLGQAGGGSTAFILWLARNYADLAVSEPDSILLRRDEPPLSRDDRARHKQDMYCYMWDVYQQERTRRGDTNPILMVSKFMPHLWYNDDTMHELLRLDDRPIWLVRHPALAVSAWLDKRIELLLAGVEVGVGPDLAEDDCDELRLMAHTRNYSELPKSMWDVIEHHLYEGTRDQDTHRLPHDYPETTGTGESARLDRLRMVIGDRCLREYNDSLVFLHQTWKGRFNDQSRHIIDMDLFQHDPDQIARSVIEPRWNLAPRPEPECQKNPGRFIDPYARYKGLSPILMEPDKWRGEIHPPKVQPIELRRFPPYLCPALKRGAELYYNTIAMSGLKFPAYQPDLHGDLSNVFAYNSKICTGYAGSGLRAIWNTIRAARRIDRDKVLAPSGSFGL